MAEVGLLPFARIALQIYQAVLPRYRSRFRKHRFTQPQLPAIHCLVRYEDWTFREAEVRLGEHRELPQTLGLSSISDSATLYRLLKRFGDTPIDRAAGEAVRRLRGSRRLSRSPCMQAHQALLLGLSFKLYRLRHRQTSLRKSTEPPHVYPQEKEKYG